MKENNEKEKAIEEQDNFLYVIRIVIITLAIGLICFMMGYTVNDKTITNKTNSEQNQKEKEEEQKKEKTTHNTYIFEDPATVEYITLKEDNQVTYTIFNKYQTNKPTVTTISLGDYVKKLDTLTLSFTEFYSDGEKTNTNNKSNLADYKVTENRLVDVNDMYLKYEKSTSKGLYGTYLYSSNGKEEFITINENGTITKLSVTKDGSLGELSAYDGYYIRGTYTKNNEKLEVVYDEIYAEGEEKESSNKKVTYTLKDGKLIDTNDNTYTK